MVAPRRSASRSSGSSAHWHASVSSGSPGAALVERRLEQRRARVVLAELATRERAQQRDGARGQIDGTKIEDEDPCPRAGTGGQAPPRERDPGRALLPIDGTRARHSLPATERPFGQREHHRPRFEPVVRGIDHEWIQAFEVATAGEMDAARARFDGQTKQGVATDRARRSNIRRQRNHERRGG